MLRRFVVCADEVHRLQTGTDPEARLAQKVFEQGHYAGRTRPTGTRQGIYATAPSGNMLASINSNDPRAVASMLRRALDRWSQMSESERMLGEDPGARRREIRRAEDFFPTDGLALRVFSRDLPGGTRPSDWRANAWNQSYVWFRREELSLPLTQVPKSGETLPVTQVVIRRLATLNFVDNVRGQTSPYGVADLKRADLRATVLGRRGKFLELEFRGWSHAKKEGIWSVNGFADMNNPTRQGREVNLELFGLATLDTEVSRFTRFEMIAIGDRRGATQYNGRHNDLGPAPIGFYLTLAGAKPSERVAPDHFWAYGWR